MSYFHVDSMSVCYLGINSKFVNMFYKSDFLLSNAMSFIDFKCSLSAALSTVWQLNTET